MIFNDAFPWNLANPAIRANGVARTGARTFSGKLTVKDSTPRSTPRPSTHMRVSVDLDEQGRFARVSLDGITKTSDRTASFTFSDYGSSADITAPPRSDVAEEDNPSFLSGTQLW